MSLFLTLFSCLVTFCHSTHGLSGEPKVNVTGETEDVRASNVTYYSTIELRDEMLKEWGGRTQEVQEYFDQLPSEMFKEDSDTLKFMHYWEKKGVTNIDPSQVYNITPQVRHPLGPEYTIEVNDSYVPKYRISPSEEERMDKYGTFNSPEESSEEDGTTIFPTVTTGEPPGSGEKEPEGKKKKRRRKKWPSNMDPTGKVRKRRRRTTPKSETKGKLVNRDLNLGGFISKKNSFEEAYRKNMEDVMCKSHLKEDFKKMNYGENPNIVSKTKPESNRRTPSSMLNSFMSFCRLKHKLKDYNHHHHNLSRSRKRFQKPSNFHLLPLM